MTLNLDRQRLEFVSGVASKLCWYVYAVGNPAIAPSSTWGGAQVTAPTSMLGCGRGAADLKNRVRGYGRDERSWSSHDKLRHLQAPKVESRPTCVPRF